jgi:hypothetical protein
MYLRAFGSCWGDRLELAVLISAEGVSQPGETLFLLHLMIRYHELIFNSKTTVEHIQLRSP